MIRAFVALPLPDAVRSALAVQQFLLPLPRRVAPEDFHITLTFLGEVRDEVLVAVHEGFLAVRAPAFRAEVGGLGMFGGDKPRVVFAGVRAGEDLERLQARIERIARLAGAAVEKRKFVPHVTLGRFAPPGIEDRLRLERTVAEGGGFRAGTVEVRDFRLYRSHLGVKEHRYEELARYPLVGGEGDFHA